MQKIRVLLPAYNEEFSLLRLLNKIIDVKERFSLLLDILVVNDGSTDHTLDVAKKFPLVNVVDLQPNRGLAGAMREGFKNAIQDLAEDDVVITLDADDSHDPDLFVGMITKINEGADLVIASRYRSGSRIIGLAGHRKIMSSVAGYLFRIFSPIKGVKDYTCGYRAYKVKLLKQAHEFYGEKLIEQKGFACMAEIILKLRRFKPVVNELPFILRYDQKKGESKMNVFKTVKQTLRLILIANRYQ